MSQLCVNLTSLKCRMALLSHEIQLKQEEIHRELNKMKTTMFSANPGVRYMAPELLLELIRSRLVNVTPMVDQIIKMQEELEDRQKELNNVIVDFINS